jgi:methionyl-tRNA formyltransferase
LVIWTDQLEWSAPPRRWRKIASRYRRRAKRHGWTRALDEVLYYAVYYTLRRRRDARKIRALIEGRAAPEGAPGSMEDIQQLPPSIRQIRPGDIQAPEVLEAISAERLDALFSMCIDVLLPEALISEPRLGSYLWHEGITPEYRGVHSPFWALANGDYGKLGYTMLKMNMNFDAGEVFVQGTARDVDPLVDPPAYIGHKAILDSLPETERFLEELEHRQEVPLERAGAEDRLYSYPTASALAKISWQRRRAKLSRLLGSPRKS